ncbi:MAG TPA: helix-turn-helix domain-containing protein [Gemmatimonadales bacterium]|nr:helix-turn-helix domain-containing protein [Gemmatimonadales bacterium]
MKAMTILVLHGDPAVREELVSVLRGGGYTTLAADNAGSVAAQLDGKVDAVLLDLKQAEVDRDTLLQALTPPAEPDSLEAAERRHLSRVLRHTDGNKRRAALILGISRSTLLNKVRKYRLEDG